MTDKTAPTDHPIEPLLAERWSPRAFTSQALSQADLDSLFEAARWAASASNSQPWAFVHAAHGSADFERLLGCLAEGNKPWAKTAPLLVIAIARIVKDDGKAMTHGRYDLGQAVAQLAIQATALGLHIHQMAGFDAERARTELGIPANHEAVTAIAIGRLGEASTLPEPYLSRESAPRTRNPASSFVFAGRWPQTTA